MHSQLDLLTEQGGFAPKSSHLKGKATLLKESGMVV